MALTKSTEEDKIEVVSQFKHIQIRTATVIKEDGTELSRSFKRRVLHPGSIDISNNYTKTNITGESSQVQGICNASWTDAVHDAFKAELIADKSKPS